VRLPCAFASQRRYNAGLTLEEVKTQSLQWTVPDCPFPVVVDAPLINEIRIAVVEAFYSVPRGGVEIGGVFFGVRRDQNIEIRAHRPIKCEYLTGPSFSLSVKDQIGLAGVLAAPETDPELAGMVPLGWYHSHTRSKIFLSAADLVLYNEFFPEKWQIAMVLRPANLQPTRGLFFFRDERGQIAPDPPAGEFVMEPPAYGLAFTEESSSIAVVGAGKSDHPAAPAEAAAATTEPPGVGQSPEPREEATPEPKIGLPSFDLAQSSAASNRRNAPWLVAAAVIILAIAAVGFAYLHWRPTTNLAGLGLETYDLNGSFLIRWDRDSDAVRQAKRAVLEIQDGGDTTPVELTAGQLAAGGYGYTRRSRDVSVRMKVEGPIAADETSNFTTSQSLEPPSGPSGDTDLSRALQEKERLKTELINDSMKMQELRATAAELRRQLAAERERNGGGAPPR